ncbi:hypothetical protein PTKIN_Ptkin01aG0030500 [Pterospermum kingtungense]
MGSLENQNNKPNIVNEDDEAWINSYTIVTSSVLPMVLNAIIELNVFEIIDQAPAPGVSAAFIVSKLPQTSNNRRGSSALDRMLRLLATHSLLTCSVRKLENGGYERLYGVTKAGKFFIKSEHGSLASFSILTRKQALADDLRCCMKYAVLEGAIPFNKVYNMSVYEYVPKDPKMNEVFDNAMSDQSSIIMNQILNVYKGFEGLTSLVDVGGGNGTALHFIISKYPSIRGINFDLPRLSNNAPSYQALPDTGKVIVVEMIYPEMVGTSPLSKFASQLDNIMLVQYGAKERLEEEYKALAMASGFSGFQVACHVYGQCIMEFHKRY